MNHFEIDQSGKIEEINHDTVLALHSGEIQYTIKISSQVKQSIFFKYKKRFKKKLVFRIFAIGLCLLLKNKIKPNSIVIIDDEYPKHGKDIKQLLLNNLRQNKIKIDPQNIRFECVGKKSFVHKIGIQTFNGKIKPNEIISEKQIRKYKLLKERDAKA